MKRKLLIAFLLTTLSSQFVRADWTGNAIANEGRYYLYNIGAEQFLGAGNDWGTQTSLENPGLQVQVFSKEEGTYYEIATYPTYGTNSAWNYFKVSNDKVYVDGAWKDLAHCVFTEVEGQANVYTLKVGENYLVWEGSGTALTLTSTAPTTNNGYWKLVTQADRIVALSSATSENPMDATFFISNSNINRNAALTWTLTGGATEGMNGVSETSGNVNYRSIYSWGATFSVSQTLSDLPAGLYRLQVSGFTQNSCASLYAGSLSTTLINYDNSWSFSNAPAAAAGFNYGNDATYLNTVDDIIVTSTGTLEIGVRSTTANSDWNVVKYFRLYYLGESSTTATPTASLIDFSNDGYPIYKLYTEDVPSGKSAVYAVNGEDIVGDTYTFTSATTVSITSTVSGFTTSSALSLTGEHYNRVVNKVFSDEDHSVDGVTMTGIVTYRSSDHIVYAGSNTSWSIGCSLLTEDMILVLDNPWGDPTVLYNTTGTLSGKTSTNWYAFQGYAVYAKDGATVNVSIGSDGLSTYSSIVPLDFSSATNIAAYKASVSGHAISLSKVTEIAAGEGVLIRSVVDGNGATNEDIPLKADVSKSDGNAFVGNLIAKTLSQTDGDYTNYYWERIVVR